MKEKTKKFLYRNASYTLEAAFVMPLFIFACAAFMNFFLLIKVEIQTEAALQYAARSAAAESLEQISDDIDILGARLLFDTFLHRNGDGIDEYVSGGIAGITFYGSSIDENYLNLSAQYTFMSPMDFFNIGQISVKQNVKAKRWVGYVKSSQSDDNGEKVYITATGSAYHSTDQCAYLKLSIKQVAASSVSSLRNENGAKYSKCSCCSGNDSVYITSYGDTYHGDLNCSSLKRTISEVNINDISGYHACPKCH